jgi:hypothetical protein
MLSINKKNYDIYKIKYLLLSLPTYLLPTSIYPIYYILPSLTTRKKQSFYNCRMQLIFNCMRHMWHMQLLDPIVA